MRTLPYLNEKTCQRGGGLSSVLLCRTNCPTGLQLLHHTGVDMIEITFTAGQNKTDQPENHKIKLAGVP